MKDIIISVEDMSVIEELAKKYNVKVNELCKLVMTPKKYMDKQIRYSDEEIELLDTKVQQAGMNRSEYVMRRIEDVINDMEFYMNVDVRTLRKGTFKPETKRTNKVHIYFKKPEVADALEDMAKKLSLPLSALVRLISLGE